jgi:hypothetical protein
MEPLLLLVCHLIISGFKSRAFAYLFFIVDISRHTLAVIATMVLPQKSIKDALSHEGIDYLTFTKIISSRYVAVTYTILHLSSADILNMFAIAQFGVISTDSLTRCLII